MRTRKSRARYMPGEPVKSIAEIAFMLDDPEIRYDLLFYFPARHTRGPKPWAFFQNWQVRVLINAISSRQLVHAVPRYDTTT